MNWIEINCGHKPPRERVLICYCPDWCDSGYQIAKWNGDSFVYDEQPNPDFNDHVQSWAIFMEAD